MYVLFSTLFHQFANCLFSHANCLLSHTNKNLRQVPYARLKACLALYIASALRDTCTYSVPYTECRPVSAISEPGGYAAIDCQSHSFCGTSAPPQNHHSGVASTETDTRALLFAQVSLPGWLTSWWLALLYERSLESTGKRPILVSTEVQMADIEDDAFLQRQRPCSRLVKISTQ